MTPAQKIKELKELKEVNASRQERIDRLLELLGKAEARANLAERRLEKATERLALIAAWLAPNRLGWDFETRIKHSAAQTLKEIGEMK